MQFTVCSLPLHRGQADSIMSVDLSSQPWMLEIAVCWGFPSLACLAMIRHDWYSCLRMNVI